MVKISRRLLFTILIAFLIVTPFVLGADLLGPIFQNFKGTNLGQTYVNYAPFIDAIIYIWLFISVAKGALKDKLSNQVAVAMGIILGVAMCVFELTSKFNLGKLGPFAAIILFLIIGMFLFNLIKNFGGNGWLATSIAFLVMYSLIQVMAPDLVSWIQKTGWLGTLLSILFLISIIGLLYGIFSLFKGIKSGEWGASRSRRREDEAEKTFKKNNRKEEIESNRKKKAAEKIFKLETEMGNLNNNIKQLEQAEANSFNRNLKNRQDQIQTVAELSSALNRSWELQKQLQELYAKSSQPAYAQNQEYLDSIKQATQQLDDFLKRISDLLLKLHDGVINTEKEEREEDTQIRTELDAQIQNLDATVKKYEDALLTLEAKSDVKGAVATDLKSIEDVARRRKDILTKLKETQALLEKNRNEILLRDQKNLTDLKHAIDVSDQNPTKNLNKLVRGINIAKDSSQIWQDLDSSKGFIGAIGALANLRNQYLSGDNLRQIYQAVKNVHTTLQEIVALINTEKTQITTKNNLLKEFNDLQAVLQAKKGSIIKTRLKAGQKEFDVDMIKINTFKDKLTKRSEDITKSNPAAIHTFTPAEISEFKNIAESISDTAMKALLKAMNENIEKILKRYNDDRLGTKGNHQTIMNTTTKELASLSTKLAEDEAAFEVRHKNYNEVLDLESKLAQATSNNNQTQSQIKIQ